MKRKKFFKISGQKIEKSEETRRIQEKTEKNEAFKKKTVV